MRRWSWMLLLMLSLGLLPRFAVADARLHVEALATTGGMERDRAAGSAGAQASADYIVRQLSTAPLNQYGQTFRQAFLMTVPRIETCRIGENGKQLPIHPLLPMGGQPPCLGDVGSPLAAPVLYAGAGTLEELKGQKIAGSVVALEISASEGSVAWQRWASLGAAAILFLGDNRANIADFLNKTTTLPLAIPRLYCDDPSTVSRVRTGALTALSMEMRVAWVEKRVENIIWVSPGHSTTMHPPVNGPVIRESWTNQWVILQSRYDGASQVLGAAPGATQSLNAGTLLDIAGQIAGASGHCGVVCVWTAGDEWNNRGTREFLDLVRRGYRDPTLAPAALRRHAADAMDRLQSVQEIFSGVQQVADAGWMPSARGLAEGPRQAIEEEVLRVSSQLEEQLQLARLRNAGALTVDRLKKDKSQLQIAANIVARRYTPGAGENTNELARIQACARRIMALWQRDVARRTAEAETLRNGAEIRMAMPSGDPLIMLSLALTGGDSPHFGVSSRSAYSSGLDVTGRMAPFTQAFRRYAENVAPGVFVPQSMETGFTLETFFPTPMAFSSDAAIARGLPAAAIATMYDRAAFLDTPADLPERLDWEAIHTQQRGLNALLLGEPVTDPSLVPAFPRVGVLTDPRFYGRAELPNLTADQPLTLFERAVGETLPRLKAAETLVGGESEIYRHPLGDPLAGTRRTDWYLTHADGTAVFGSANRVLEAEVRLQAFRFDPAGHVLQAILANQKELTGLVADFYPDPERPLRAMVFDCRRLDLYGLFDPRYLDHLEELSLLDARRLDAIQLSSDYARQGMAAIFLPSQASGIAGPWQLLASRGSTGNRMVLLNSDAANPAGVGFETTAPALIGPPAWRTAKDFAALDTQRKKDLEKFGISNEVIRELQAATDRQMAAAYAAEDRRDYPAFFAAADAVWSLQSQEYQNLIDTSNGIIKGVIFLLLGVIPFSYFLERLLIGSPRIYTQIAWFAGIFACMTAGLWFHPAFRISTAPLMILLAFLILILSSTVVYILWGKFEEEISRLRGTTSAAHMGSFNRGAVLGAAVRLGLSNMRRRGMRTGLTLLTLILLTFTLLCFTSARESVQVTPRPVVWTGAAALGTMPPSGILLRQRGWRELPLQTVELARGLALPAPVTLAQKTEPAAATGIIARRWWYASERPEQPWLLPLLVGKQRPSAPPKVGNETNVSYHLSGLIGLDANELAFQGATLEAVLPSFGQLRDRPEPGLAPICWLPGRAREALHLAVGESVRLAGIQMTIAGFFDPAAFARLRHLSGDAFSPLDPGALKQFAPNAARDESFKPETGYRFLDAVSVAIVPAWVIEQAGGRLTSIMLRPAGIDAMPDENQAAQLHAVATALAQRSAFTVYVSDGRAIQSINAAEASRPQDFSTVLVPMILAGIIVLNTMLGAVSERTREIHVYTSVGLSPAHVGMLFLAEAAALGTLGVVFGYIFGQGLATVLSWTHLLPGVDLNYSSMSAILTMGIVLGIVMLSALWPARAATRVAAPSLQRDWKLPRPVGDLLAVDLPFTVNETAARGVCAFLAEFLVSISQSGTGHFTADNLQGFVQATTQGPVRGLIARIWLAPYDLGVIQVMRLSIHPTDQPGVFDVHVQLTREAGNPPAWRRLNRPFLVEIRRQFLLWRAVDAHRMQEYVQQSDALFATPTTP